MNATLKAYNRIANFIHGTCHFTKWSSSSIVTTASSTLQAVFQNIIVAI